MIEKEDIYIDKNDSIEVNVIGYKNKGESIVLTIGNKFLGVIDCYKTKSKFLTKDIIKEKGIPIDFLCWTHSDWDHSYGIFELKEFFDENTHLIMPSGFQAKEFRHFLEKDKNRGYQYQEYCNILNFIERMDYDHFHSANQDTVFYSFALKDKGILGSNSKYDVRISSFSPISKQIREYNCNHICTVYENNDFMFKNINADNNIFSVGLMIEIGNSTKINKLCFTGDLMNDTIELMSENTWKKLFLRNTFLKIPHHGSANSNKILKYDKKRVSFSYAACTSFKTVSSDMLPTDIMMQEYRKGGIVHKTNLRDQNGYGVVKYIIPIINETDLIKVSFIGDAGKWDLQE